MRTHTYGSSLALIGVTVPGHLIADTEVPILTGPQAQGDLIVYPTSIPTGIHQMPVTPAGVQVVIGEATGNSHWLHAGMDSPNVLWAHVDEDLVIGYLTVPEGETAMLIHTDEHGSNGIGPGSYAVCGKREQVDEIRRVAD